MDEHSRLISEAQTVDDLDSFCWQAICDWSTAADVQTVYAGIDYAELTRCLLWDKVARAIRRQTDPQQFEFEQAWLSRRSLPEPLTPYPNQLKFWIKRSRSLLQTWQDVRSLQSAPVYVPCAHPTLRSVVEAIAESIPVVAPQGTFNSSNVQTIRLPLLGQPNLDRATSLHQGILTGLQKLGVELLETDAIVLHHQIVELLLRTQQIETELSILRPKAILVFADNHVPVQSYVLVARKLGIRSIMLQHGLDCEHYCLDAAYADVISVWGEARQRRYQQQSSWQPSRLQANGNPDFDRLTLPDRFDCTGEYWLWTTRPHAPQKCYIPSRTPQEGIQILQALLGALKQSSARLIVKPHPLDDVALYQTYIDEHDFGDRVTFSTQPVRSLLPDARVVISEDSTVGLEAMFFGKAIVHAHFAHSEPVMPFVQYDAALPGRSPEQLQASLRQIELLTEQQQQSLFAGQRRFLQAYAGECDGKALSRVLSMIRAVLAA